jgi:hypothetical protein
MGEAHQKYMEENPDAKFCKYCGRYVLKPEVNREEEPNIVRREAPFHEWEETHPSYGQITISRFQGGYPNFYGSKIRHNGGITLKITRSVKHRSEYSETYYATNTLAEIVMTDAQFATLITSLNIGEGVPCTLRNIRGEYMPLCPEKSLEQEITSDLNSRLAKIAENFKAGCERIEEILSKKGAINKKERNEIASVYNRLMQELTSNLPFLHECMTESIQKSMHQAKVDIEAYYQRVVQAVASNRLSTTYDAEGRVVEVKEIEATEVE